MMGKRYRNPIEMYGFVSQSIVAISAITNADAIKNGVRFLLE
jgi:hypothetical protein